METVVCASMPPPCVLGSGFRDILETFILAACHVAKKLAKKNSDFLTNYIEEDSRMMTFQAILLSIFTLVTMAMVYKLYSLYRKERELDMLGSELNAIVENIIEDVKKQKKVTAGIRPMSPNPDLLDPGLLSTLVTVMVNKHGTINLSLEDFAALSDEEYVSVYVDADNKTIILSLDHNLSSQDPLSMIKFTNVDDNTYH